MDFAVNIENAFSPMLLRRLNTWFSIRNGNWSDPETWLGNGLDKKNITYPQPGDNVYVNHSVTFDLVAATVNNLYGNGYLTIAAIKSLTVNGDIQITGTVDQSAGNNNLILNGYNNIIVNYISSTTGIIVYNGSLTQSIMNLSYGGLTSNGGKKFQTSNLTLSGAFLTTCSYEVGPYNLTVTGTTTIANNNTGVFSKNGSGNIIFVGKLIADNSTGLGYSSIDFSAGNPNVEFRGGLTKQCYLWKTGTGTFTFSTNNQTINNAINGELWDCNILISGAITVTATSSGSAGALVVNNTLNGNNAASTLNNNGNLWFASTTLPMTTGVFNYQNTTSASIGYVMNGSYTLPYTNYNNGHLYISGTGFKTLGGNTTVLTLDINSNFDTGIYTLTVNGVTNLGNANTGLFKNTGGGAMLFIGNFKSDGATGLGFGSFDFSAGNPTIEFRGGVNIQCYNLNFGTGTITFSTNNQSFFCYTTIVAGTNALAGNILISGAITVTLTSNISGEVDMTGVLNGNNAASIFDCRGNFNYKNATAPMVTGKLYCNQAANTFTYGLLGNQDITTPTDPSSPGYYNLTLNGSGAKRLLANVSVKQVYTLTPPATLNSNGFSLTNP